MRVSHLTFNIIYKQMKKTLIVLVNIIFIGGLVLTSSCYSSKRGIVPCPSYGKAKAPVETNAQIIVKPV